MNSEFRNSEFADSWFHILSSGRTILVSSVFTILIPYSLFGSRGPALPHEVQEMGEGFFAGLVLLAGELPGAVSPVCAAI